MFWSGVEDRPFNVVGELVVAEVYLLRNGSEKLRMTCKFLIMVSSFPMTSSLF